MPDAKKRVVLTIELDVETVELLGVLGKLESVLYTLAGHAGEGVSRPGSWERGWLIQVVGEEFLSRLEQNPEVPFLERPKRGGLQ